jgi:hypothetical protein
MSKNLTVRDAATTLAMLEDVQKKLATIRTVDEARKVRDQAAAFESFAKTAKLGLDLQNRCALVKILAERRLGELLNQMERLRGRPQKALPLTRLSDIGVDYNESHRWRLLAKISPEELDAVRQDCDAMYRELTVSYVMRQVKSLTARDDYIDATRPWEAHWRDRKQDKQTLEATNWWYGSLTMLSRPEAKDKLDVIGRDTTYLNAHDVRRLLAAFGRGVALLIRGEDGMQRRLEGRPRELFEHGPCLLTVIGETCERHAS